MPCWRERSQLLRGTHQVDDRNLARGLRRRALWLIPIVIAGLVPLIAAPTHVAASSYESTVEGNSPAAYWIAGDGSDSSGNGNTATGSGTITTGVTGPIDGDSNTAITLDGSSGYAEASDASSLNPTSHLTIEAWVNTTSGQFSNGYFRYLVHKAASATSWNSPYVQYGLAINDTSGYTNSVWFGFSYGGGNLATLVVNDAGWTYGAWNHIVGTYD